MPTTRESRAYTIIRRRGGPEETIVCNRLFVAEGFVHFVDRKNTQPPYDEKLLLLIPADLIAEVRPVDEAGMIAKVDTKPAVVVQPGQNCLVRAWQPELTIIDHDYMESEHHGQISCGIIVGSQDMVPIVCGQSQRQHHPRGAKS